VTLQEGLQAVLAAEQAAVYGYGVVGARVPDGRREEATAAHAAHLRQRDRVEDLLRAIGSEPEPGEPAYALPFPVEAPRDAVRLAVVIEEGVAAAYADLVSAGTEDVRAAAAAALQQAAVRAASWRRASVPFPGLGERS
jgi:Domain of unknown function (DUF4439)